MKKNVSKNQTANDDGSYIVEKKNRKWNMLDEKNLFIYNEDIGKTKEEFIMIWRRKNEKKLEEKS